MCEDLIFVTTYCPNESQVLRLNQCIDRLNKLENFHIALISHTHVPIEIQKKVQYYIYDHLNELSDDVALKHVERHRIYVDKQLHKTLGNRNMVLTTSHFKKTPFYGFAIYRMFSLISKLAINFNYKRLYHVEYDFLIDDLSMFTNHKKILENYDSVFYRSAEKSEMILGGLKSFKVDKLPNLFKDYNREEMTKRIINEDLIPLEMFTEKIFTEVGNMFKIDFKVIKDRVQSTKFKEQEMNWCLYYNRETEFIGFCYLNFFEKSIFKIVMNGKHQVNLEIEKDKNAYVELSESKDLKYIKIFRDGKVLYESEITNDLIQNLKQNSYVTVE
jgi:hypothetical protein